MIRDTRAAALAGVVLLIAQPAAARDADWWQLDEEVANGATSRYLADLGAVRPISPDVSELHVLMQVEEDGAPIAWVDAQLRLDCRAGKLQSVSMAEYDAGLKRVRGSGQEDWFPLPPGHSLGRFVCGGERDGFQRRPDFVAPKF
ncbi:hypothetical protein [Caulobacter sp. 17J65-9]|uniref:hypothetical protein n=1 Tax=Caulobacter sp. 17J65-9 TaxID=2709382 RepID=UPI0013CA7AAA|nr:hypothetical protein [Caulobacter sp. 17J65-9]NEX94121.1 hypothetical protein [Caulobacter sp. 17J65-9]